MTLKSSWRLWRGNRELIRRDTRPGKLEEPVGTLSISERTIMNFTLNKHLLIYSPLRLKTRASGLPSWVSLLSGNKPAAVAPYHSNTCQSLSGPLLLFLPHVWFQQSASSRLIPSLKCEHFLGHTLVDAFTVCVFPLIVKPPSRSPIILPKS